MWHLASLVHDKHSAEIADFFRTLWTDGVHEYKAAFYDKENPKKPYAEWCKYEKQDVINDTECMSALPKDGRVITVYGHGNFHHYTYGITHHVMMPRSKRFVYVQIDNHTDNGRGSAWKADDGTQRHDLTCGSFTTHIKDNGARAWLYIGTDVSCGKPVKYIRQEHLINARRNSIRFGEPRLKQFIMREARVKRTEDCYISMDLDVVRYEDCATGYGQGKITLEDMLEILEALKDVKNVLGADILGYQIPQDKYSYGPPESKKWHYQKEISKLTYLILASKLAGKDFHEAMKLRHWILKKHRHQTNSVDVSDLLLDFRV